MPANNGYIAKLSKAPLQEVIFEAFWELDIDSQTGQSFDPGFDLAQGIFGESLKKEFPVYKRVAPAIVPLQVLKSKPVHQFWKGGGKWPVLQIGPGLLAANDTEKTYIWESGFRPTIEFALATLLKSYKEPLRFNKVSLRYIDVFELEGEFKEDFVKFIETNLQIHIVRNFEVAGIINDQSVNHTYLLEDGSKLHLVVSNGSRNNKPVVILQTAVVKEKQLSLDEIKSWISTAHTITSSLFKRILLKEFYDSLK